MAPRVFFCNSRVPMLLAVLIAHLATLGGDDALGENGEQQLARQILDVASQSGGLVVHLGCGKGELTAALRADERFLVHGLDADADDIRRAREHIQSLGMYGPVAVTSFDGRHLPYADNLVNLVVAEDLGDVPMAEVMRVLAPAGAVCVKENGRWQKTVKPRSTDIDEWTHYLHGPSGNAAAHDKIVGPPRHMQWINEPRHTRSHEHIPSIFAVVSASGRLFYIIDEAATESIRQTPQWHVVARDAFNGILLWKQPIAAWFPHVVNWGQTPRQLQRKLVAVGDRVYVTLGLHAPLTALDAETGETIMVYEGTHGTEEIVLHRGTLLLALRGVGDERVAELERWARLVKDEDSPLYERETAAPLVSRLRATESQGNLSVLALDADSGRVLWTKTGADVSRLRTYSLCATADRVFYQNAGRVVCLDIRTGQQLWSTATAPLRLVSHDRVFCAGGQQIAAISVETGKTEWTQAATLVDIRDLFVANDALWVGGFEPCEGKRGPSWGPYFATKRDLTTGEVLLRVEPENPGHHHRCYLNKATDRYILAGRRGVEFVDLNSGEHLWHSWVRGVCKYGVVPCNGLLYAPPHACACCVAAKLTGFNALAPERTQTDAVATNRPDLERGPAFDAVFAELPSRPNDWPTYRRDAQRSGTTPSPVPANLQMKWQNAVSQRQSSPTVSDGKVFVAARDEHAIRALDATSGKSCWQFTAGARVDSPPTLYGGRAIFGCRDGYVYSVRATDGVLAWRRQVARQPHLIAANGQLESAGPVHGSVLVQDGVATLTVGRSSYLDGGIDLCRVAAHTGELLSRTEIYSPDADTGRQPDQFGPNAMPGDLADILTSDADHVYLRDAVFDQRGERQAEGSPHLFALTGFLDDTWAHRSYWVFGRRCSISTGCSGRDKNLIYGRLLVFDDATIYGFGRETVHWSNRLQDGRYRLFAMDRDDGDTHWAVSLPIRVQAMVLAEDLLFVAGSTIEADWWTKDRDRKRQGQLLAVSISNGKVVREHPLDGPPVFDGMAAADGHLYVSLANGQMLCLEGKHR